MQYVFCPAHRWLIVYFCNPLVLNIVKIDVIKLVFLIFEFDK